MSIFRLKQRRAGPTGLRLLGWLALLLVLLGTLAAGWLWQQLEQRGIALHLEGPGLGRHGLQLQQLRLSWPDSTGTPYRLQAESLHLQISPRLPAAQLTIKTLQLQLQVPQAQQGTAPSAFTLPAITWPSWLAWLPDTLQIDQLSLQLPCPGQPCRLSGPLRVQHAGQQLQAGLQLSGTWADQPLQIQGELEASAQGIGADLKVHLPRLEIAGWRLQDVRLALPLQGSWQAPGLELHSRAGAHLQIARLEQSALALRLDALQLRPQSLQLSWASEASAVLTGELALSLARLQHPALQPGAWRTQLRLRVNERQGHLQGTLNNEHGLALTLQATAPRAAPLQLEVRLAELDFARGNPLAASLRHWPAALSLSAGRLQAHLHLSQPAQGRPKLQGELQLEAVDALFERLALSALRARLRLQLQGERVSLELPELHLSRLNTGIALGPLRARASYQGNWRDLQSGQLILYQLESGLLGGHLRVHPDDFPLRALPVTLRVQLEALELGQLLQAYPAEGLEGSGLLDGWLPVQLDANGVYVAAGQLQARAPGGVLQLRSPAIRAYGQSNPALGLATGLLEDFHYTQLAARLSYDPQQQLHLILRLQGHNPQLEGGRAVNFSIDLQENLAALLTSLQLSGRVGEIIQRRAQQGLPVRP